ncbi:MAG: hypothetical protein V3S29_05780, partial [bacterium]
QRIPETIVSRCQRYDFARIPVGTMVDYLVAVTEAEQLTFSRNALEAIARGAAGGMRDALTAIDRVVSYAGAHPEEEQVFSALGLTDDRETLNLLAAVLEKDLQAALETFESLIAKGSDLNGMLAALLTDLKELSLFRTLKGEGSYFQDHTSAAKEFFAAQKDRASLDQLQQLFYLFLELERQLRLSEFGRACFEMALIKACRVEPLVGVSELLQQVKELKNAPAAGGPLLENEHRHEHRPPGGGRQRAREGGANVGAGPPSSPAGDPDSEAEPAPPERAAAPAQPGLPTAPPAAATAQPDPEPPPTATETTAQEPTAEKPTVEQTAEGQSAGERSAGQQSPEGQSAEEEPSLAESLPCEDGRWIAFIDSLRGSKPKLAADLRRAEVAAIGENEVEIVPPPGAELMDGAEAGVLEESLRRAFGDAFHPRFNRDKNRKARPAYSLVARERQREGARLAAEREVATADPAVEGLLRLFPEGRVEHVQPSTANGSDDV